MAVLKKGSKGSEVKKVQTLLNKRGAKLDPDGDFGSNTEAAVKAFQKKFKLKVDGIVGPITMPTLEHGRVPPVMTVVDYVKKRNELQKSWKDTQDSISRLIRIKKEIAELDKVLSKEVGVIDKLFVENYAHWERIAKDADDLVKRQKAFEDVRLKDPIKAEKLLKECIALDAEVRAIAESLIKPNRKKMNASIVKIGPKLVTALSVIQTELDAYQKLNQ